MKIPKRISVFKDIEMSDSYFVQGASNITEATKYLESEYPETKELFFLCTEIKTVAMYRCLDCNSYWVSDDVCGECGEYRLSKRAKWVLHFYKE